MDIPFEPRRHPVLCCSRNREGENTNKRDKISPNQKWTQNHCLVQNSGPALAREKTESDNKSLLLDGGAGGTGTEEWELSSTFIDRDTKAAAFLGSTGDERPSPSPPLPPEPELLEDATEEDSELVPLSNGGKPTTFGTLFEIILAFFLGKVWFLCLASCFWQVKRSA